MQILDALAPAPAAPALDMNDSDLQAQNLFDQIELDEHMVVSQQPTSQPKERGPSKARKLQIGSEDQSDNEQQLDNIGTAREKAVLTGDDKQAEQSVAKLSKKQRKMLKKKKKEKNREKKKSKKQKKLKRMKKVSSSQKKDSPSNDQWSGESQQESEAGSDVSSDSLLNRLNPRKVKNESSTPRKSTKAKLKSTEKKEGFKLKELGVDAEVSYSGEKGGDSSEEYNSDRKKVNRKLPKKQVSKNQQILKSLLEMGLCVDEQANNQKSDAEVDNGLQQVYNMKGNKKNGIKVTNKLFADIEIKQNQAGNADDREPLPQDMQLEVKPRTNAPSSVLMNSFLSKAERIKKQRGMQSEVPNEEYDKLLALKARQSMSKLISEKQIQEAEEIILDVKVPEVVKGRQTINNSIFLKTSAQTLQQKGDSAKKPVSKPEFHNAKSKISRNQIYKMMYEDVKNRRSKNLTHQEIKKSFKVTQLQEIEDMRRKNEQRRRKKALMGSDEEDSDYDNQQAAEENQQQDVVVENNLSFLNFKIELQKGVEVQQPSPATQQAVQAPLERQEQCNKQANAAKEFAIEIPNMIPEEKFKALLRLEQNEQAAQNDEINDEDDEDFASHESAEAESSDRKNPINNKDAQAGQEDQGSNQYNLDIQDEAEGERLQLQVDLSASQEVDLQSQEMQDEEQAQESAEQKPHINEEYREYLNELEAEGIQVKKNAHSTTQKENFSLLENLRKGGQSQNQLRAEFKKLRKLASIIKKKKIQEIRLQKAGRFFEEEAEEGSDNEQNDGKVKQINYDEEEKQYEGLDLDVDLEELIDNAVDINEADEQLAFKKYMEDVKIKDREQLKRIMNGDFKRRTGENEGLLEDAEEDDKQRNRRREQFEAYMRKRQEEEAKQLYVDEKQDEEGQQEQNSQNSDINNKVPNQNQQYQYEEIDDVNEQTLKRYFDDCLAEPYRKTKIIAKPILELPQSYQRSKKNQMRNTITSKQTQLPGTGLKPKKSSSHLNEIIMKNKQVVKPVSSIKTLPIRVSKLK